MASPNDKRMRAYRQSRLAEFMLVAAMSFAAGAIVGAGGLFVYQQLQFPSPEASGAQGPLFSNPSGETQPAHPVEGGTQGRESSCSGSPPNLPGDGFFIVDADGSVIRLEGLPTGFQLNPATLPSTAQRSPRIAVRGQDLPLGSLHFVAYRAGIGVDITYGESGATINSVLEGSPAHAAGLQSGDVIFSVNGEAIAHPLVDAYVPGQHDLIGPMQAQITMEVVSGTTARTVTLPRTYRNYTSDLILLDLEDDVWFSLETGADYVLLCPEHDLQPGTYVLEFRGEPPIPEIGWPFGPTSTPRPTPIPMPGEKWAFVVR
jgi:hypothetical protein